MPSPFPGMDPHLENPDIWPDLHQALAVQLSTDLNLFLPRPYYSQVRVWPYEHCMEDAIRHQFVEVRDPSRGHRLVTLIELVSPSNKRPGPDRDAYLNKQRDLLTSDASLVEIDLHRSGERLVSHPELADQLWRLAPPGLYVVVVSRAWRRVGGGDLQVFPIPVPEPLPVIPIPLREGQAEVTLDLQYSFNRAYDGGPYRKGAVDYMQPPRPPLDGELAVWAQEGLRAAGLIGG